VLNESSDIPSLPDIPPELLKKINEQKAAFFLGAGASRLIGCLSWNALASSLAEKCLDKRYINFRKKESILEIDDPKKIITICQDIFREKEQSSVGFIEEIRRLLAPKSSLLASYNLYNELAGISAVYITTNIDTHFDSAFKDRIAYRENEFTPENIVRDKLFKIHGTIEDESSLVLTLPKYFKRYRNPIFQSFMTKIFAEYSIVFLGYGLDEFEVLDFLLNKYEKETSERKHWILLPYYEDEKYLLDYDKSYFGSMGISVIGYKKDEEGYNQLFNVIRKWRTEFRELSPIVDEDIKEMEETVDKL
jgi:hypothetical protein